MRVCRFAAWSALAGSLSILCAGCGGQSAADVQEIRPTVRFAPAQIREVTDYAYYNGRTAAQYSVNIQAQVTGYLKSIDFQAGTYVKKGQRLFKIDPTLFKAAYDEVEGQVTLAKAKLELADADLKRAYELAKTPGAISQQEVDTRMAAQKAAAAAVVAAQANSESAKANLDFTDVTSPFDGVVDRNRIDNGNLVTKDTTLLTTVVSQDPMYVYFDVDEYTMLRVERLIHEGRIKPMSKDEVAPVEMGLADQGNEYPQKGYIDFVSNQLNAGTGTLQVRGVFQNPLITSATYQTGASGSHRLLRPGMFVRVRLPLGAPYKALVVPQAAVGTDQGLKYLLVVSDKNMVEYRPVTLGAEQADGWQVVVPQRMVRTSEGLRPLEAGEKTSEPTVESLAVGDRVVVGGLQQIRPGSVVDAKPVSPGEPMSVPTSAGPGPTPSELANPLEKAAAAPPPEKPTTAH